ncbi:transmembrane protein 131-like [Bicyclus anynana]|uniref:Transmembrane protein 131-like n=1 Tax=Bicyclus anynana TaxID=110368 RepID=A0ABM3M0D0_BICAN|nr:transmembrane protein 131-like [Bicyclus anynana]
MYRNILRCYVFLLTLLDLSLKTKLTARGESHGVSIHDSLVEGITFQEWESGLEAEGEEADEEAGEEAEDEGEGVRAWPRALRFGRAALGQAHARVVTVTNRANATLHLASVAGTTPDFHASFFDSKTLAPGGNTSFTVVYLGRREGPVRALLYVHTSLGVAEYRVSAVGVASAYGVWPLLGLRVPLGARAEPALALHNPAAAPLQVREVYSSAAWLQLRLPAAAAAADAWRVPPHETRTLVHLRVAPPPHAQPLTAYVRVRADVPGGGLLLAVEARAVPAGEHARPPHVRLRAHGSRDAALSVRLELANSGGAEVPLEGGVSDAGCWRDAPPAPCAAPPAARANGGGAAGARLALLRSALAPHQDFVPAAELTLDFAELWAGAGVGAGAAEAWCAGCVQLGRALVPFSVRLLPGALRFEPPQLHLLSERAPPLELRAHNEFAAPLRVLAVRLPPAAEPLVALEALAPLTLRAGEAAALARVRLRGPAAPELALDAALEVLTERAHYRVPLRAFSGRLLFEWEWAHASAARLQLGALGASATRRVRVRLRNPAPVPLCVAALEARLPAGAASFARADAECVPPGGAAQAVLTVVAPARAGELRGELRLDTPLARGRAELLLRVRPGGVRLLPLRLPPAAPYAAAAADLLADSTMDVPMRVTSLELAPPHADPALSFAWDGAEYGWVRGGRSRVARVRHAPERRCEPACYCGLPLHSADGAAWLRRAARPRDALPADLQLLRARLQLFERQRAALARNVSLLLHTSEALHVPAPVELALAWPRLAAPGAGRAPLAAVGRAATLRLALRSAAHAPVLLQALLAPRAELPERAGGEAAPADAADAPDAFRLAGWRVTRGAAAPWNESAADALTLLLAPRAELELSVEFAPPAAGAFAAALYLRNNLTVLEAVPLLGEGEHPSFELSGRRPGSEAPFTLEVKECLWGGAGAAVRRLLARNTGRVPVTLAHWRVAGAACAARGFALRPCEPLRLAPNASLPLHVSFAPDYTLARATATLALLGDAGPAHFRLLATVPARVLAQCAAAAPRPPWDGLLRGLGVAVACAALACALAAAALDAERLLRRARAARPPAAPRAPLDLRALAEPAAPAPPPARAAARRRRAPRRALPALPALDPRAERRAFERWRAEVLRRGGDGGDSSRSSDEDEERAPLAAPAASDAASSASDASTPADERDDEPYGGDVEPDPPDDEAPAEQTRRAAPPAAAPPPAATPPPEPRPAADAPRRAERTRSDSGRRSAPARHHVRKERPGKRRPPPTPPPRSPAPSAPPPGERGAVRPWASWSSVVAARAPAPLAPIGSDVRRREPERAPDNSLFYFNGSAADKLAWLPARADVWGAWGAWPAAPLRPPPGFAAPAPAPAPPPPPLEPRAYDPFRSLASIWAPAPNDWRAAPAPASASAPAPDERRD